MRKSVRHGQAGLGARQAASAHRPQEDGRAAEENRGCQGAHFVQFISKFIPLNLFFEFLFLSFPLSSFSFLFSLGVQIAEKQRLLDRAIQEDLRKYKQLITGKCMCFNFVSQELYVTQTYFFFSLSLINPEARAPATPAKGKIAKTNLPLFLFFHFFFFFNQPFLSINLIFFPPHSKQPQPLATHRRMPLLLLPKLKLLTMTTSLDSKSF